MRYFGRQSKIAQINISASMMPSYNVTFPREQEQNTGRLDGLSERKKVIHKRKNSLCKIQDSQRAKSKEDQSSFQKNNVEELKRNKKKLINQKISLWKSCMPKNTNFIIVKQKNKSQQQSIKIDTTQTNSIANNLSIPINIQRNSLLDMPKSKVKNTLFSDKCNRFPSPIRTVQTQKQKRQRSKTLREDTNSNISQNDRIITIKYSDQAYLQNRYQKIDKAVPQLGQHYQGSRDQHPKLTRVKLNKSLSKYRALTSESIVSEEGNIEQQEINYLPINIAQIKLNKVSPNRTATIGSYFPQRAKDFQHIQKLSRPLKDEWMYQKPSPWQSELTRNNLLQLEQDQF